eukprot:5578691-Pleurochrysis_carterae.AAC.1
MKDQCISMTPRRLEHKVVARYMNSASGIQLSCMVACAASTSASFRCLDSAAALSESCAEDEVAASDAREPLTRKVPSSWTASRCASAKPS